MVFIRPPGPDRKFEDQKRKDALQIDRKPQVAEPVDVDSVSDAVGLVSTAWHVEELRRNATATRKEILVHDCFNQRAGDKQPHKCGCDVRVTYPEARNLIEAKHADFLTYRRAGRDLENRKSIVLSADFLQRKADAFGGQFQSLTDFLDYHAAPVSMEFTSGLDKTIQNVRLREIAERKKEIESVRKHRVKPKGHGPD